MCSHPACKYVIGTSNVLTGLTTQAIMVHGGDMLGTRGPKVRSVR